jgi:hypothetical protein
MSSMKMLSRWKKGSGYPLLGQLSPVKGDMDSFTMNLDENMECSELSIA